MKNKHQSKLQSKNLSILLDNNNKIVFKTLKMINNVKRIKFNEIFLQMSSCSAEASSSTPIRSECVFSKCQR